MPAKVPTLHEWLGGSEALSRLIERFYEKVPSDPLLAPLFASMPKEHFEHVAQFIAEVFGGPADYSALHGGHAAMIRHHLGKGITEPQRKRWVALLLETADELQLPGDPEFRSALVAYLEWGFATGRHQLSPIAGYGCREAADAFVELGGSWWALPAGE